MKIKKELSTAINDFTLSMEYLNEFIHLGEVASQRNALRNPDYFFADLTEKVQVLKSKMDVMLSSI